MGIEPTIAQHINMTYSEAWRLRRQDRESETSEKPVIDLSEKIRICGDTHNESTKSTKSVKRRKIKKSRGSSKANRVATSVMKPEKKLSEAFELLRNRLYHFETLKVSRLKEMIANLEEGEINRQYDYSSGGHTLLNTFISVGMRDHLQRFNQHFEELLVVFLEAGADPNICNQDTTNDGGNAALHTVVDHYKCLHRTHFKTEGKASQVRNYFASRSQKNRLIRVLQILQKHGAEINGLNRLGLTPLQVLCINDTYTYRWYQGYIPRKTLPDIAKCLVDMGAEVNFSGKYCTPIHMLILSCLSYPEMHNDRKMALIDTLLDELGADLNVHSEAFDGYHRFQKVGAGDTPLHSHVKQIISVSNSEPRRQSIYNFDLVLMGKILGLGADVNAVNAQGHSPLSLVTLQLEIHKGDSRETTEGTIFQTLHDCFIEYGGTLSDQNKEAIVKDLIVLETVITDEQIKAYPFREMFLKGELFSQHHYRNEINFFHLLRKEVYTMEEAENVALTKGNNQLSHTIFSHYKSDEAFEKLQAAYKKMQKKLGKKRAKEIYFSRLEILVRVHPDILKKF